MRLLDAISFMLILLLFSAGAVAQNSVKHDLNVDIREVALLALRYDGDGTIDFASATPNSAGQAINLASENESEIWVNYSSIVELNKKRKVTATVLGEIPEGIELKVKASEYQGSGKGILGRPADYVSLSNGSVDVISNIGSCYTGQGIQNGHMLTYTVELKKDHSAYDLLKQKKASLQIIYTLTDDN